jgi:multisubunit Na+/H+ antiporter MnhB subunit
VLVSVLVSVLTLVSVTLVSAGFRAPDPGFRALTLVSVL